MQRANGTICTPLLRAPPGVRGAGPGSLLPKLIGVDTVRADGSPTVVNIGISSSNPMITACSPNDVSVIQLRRPLSAQQVSNKLSANMVSSSVNSCLLLWTPQTETQSPRAQKNKGRVVTRPSGTFRTREVFASQAISAARQASALPASALCSELSRLASF